MSELHFQRVEVNPGDVLFAFTDRLLRADQRAELERKLLERTPATRVEVIDGGMTLGIFAPGRSPAHIAAALPHAEGVQEDVALLRDIRDLLREQVEARKADREVFVAALLADGYEGPQADPRLLAERIRSVLRS